MINKDINERIINVFVNELHANKDDIKFIMKHEGGMSNLTYLFSVNNKKYAVHYTEKNGLRFVNRDYELSALNVTKNNPFVQKCVYFDKENLDLRIYEYIDGTSLNSLDYKNYIKEVSNSLKSFHQMNKFDYDYKPFDYLTKMENEVQKDDLNELYNESKNVLLTKRSQLINRELYPCHNDAQPSNLVLSDDNKVYIIDLEFAANNDYLYDIATFGNLEFKYSILLLNEYKKNHSKDELLYLILWRIFINMQWYLVAKEKYHLGYNEILNLDFNDIGYFFLNKNRELIDLIKNDRILEYEKEVLKNG